MIKETPIMKLRTTFGWRLVLRPESLKVKVNNITTSIRRGKK